MASLQYKDLMVSAPGTLAGTYLRKFWQPIFLSEKLGVGKAKPVKVMHEAFTLFRGASGKAHLIDARCPHRGVQLSAGWVEDDCIRCMYHGWMFDGDGQCVDQPAEPETYKKQVKIRSYPVEEYLGLIFAWFGDGTPPPLPRYPWFEDEGVLVADSYVRPSNYFYTLDNHSDEVHVIFTHRNTAFTRAGLVTVPSVEAEEMDYGIRVVARSPNGKVRANQLLMPNIITFKSSPSKSDGSFSDRSAWRVPIDDNSHLSFGVNLHRVQGEAAVKRFHDIEAKERRKVEGPESAEVVAQQILNGERSLDDADVLERPDLVNIQDNVAQMSQPLVDQPFDEMLGRSDRGVVLFRKIWYRELEALRDGKPLKDWRIPERLATQTGTDG